MIEAPNERRHHMPISLGKIEAEAPALLAPARIAKVSLEKFGLGDVKA